MVEMKSPPTHKRCKRDISLPNQNSNPLSNNFSKCATPVNYNKGSIVLLLILQVYQV